MLVTFSLDRNGKSEESGQGGVRETLDGGYRLTVAHNRHGRFRPQRNGPALYLYVIRQVQALCCERLVWPDF
jgi:hypothetical protein